MIFILLFTLNFLSVYVICTCLHLGTNGIFDNVNIESFHSSRPSQKQDPLPSVWLQRALHRHRRDHWFECCWSHLNFQVPKRDSCLNCRPKFEDHFSHSSLMRACNDTGIDEATWNRTNLRRSGWWDRCSTIKILWSRSRQIKKTKLTIQTDSP